MSSKTLSIILTIFKVAKIVAKVVFILCIVGGACCLIAMTMIPFAGSIMSALFPEEGIDIFAAYPACIAGSIACAGEAVFAFFAERYFGNVLNHGTPFTFEGAKECFRLGIASVIISVATSVAESIAVFAAMLIDNSADIKIDSTITLSTGIFFLFMSLIFKYGAELRATVSEEPVQDEESSGL